MSDQDCKRCDRPYFLHEGAEPHETGFCDPCLILHLEAKVQSRDKLVEWAEEMDEFLLTGISHAFSCHKSVLPKTVLDFDPSVKCTCGIDELKSKLAAILSEIKEGK